MTTDGATKIESREPARSRGAHPPARRVLEQLLVLGATVTAVIFLAGLVTSLVRLFFVQHPYLGFTDTIVAGAEAVATGHFQYGNPATEYVGQGYAPLFTFLLAGLLKVYWWAGWEQVLSILAISVSMGALIRMMRGTTRRMGSRLVNTSVVVALSFGGLSAIPGLYLYGVDQLAWCFLVIAGAVTFRGLLSPTGLSRKQMLVTGLLLTASVFSKQTTVVPCLLLAGAALAVPVYVEPQTWKTWRRSATVLVSFATSSALFGIVLQVASHGWAYDLLVSSQFRYARTTPLGKEIGPSLRLLTVPLVALAVLIVCVAWSLRANPQRYQPRNAAVAVAAVVVAISSVPTAILAETKLGGEANQLAGPVWTLTLGCAVLLLLLHPSVRQLTAGAITCGVLLVSIYPLSHAIPGAPNLGAQRATWRKMDPFLTTAVAEGEAVYDPAYPSLSVSSKSPSYPAGPVNDLLASGYAPRWFTNNLLSGRYALVAPNYLSGSLGSLSQVWSSDEGRYDGSVLWKYNLLLQMGYTPITDPVSGLAYYRPTPRLKQLGWFARCFGPYQARDAGVDVRLQGPGGLVCIDGGGLHLSQAPDRTTNFVMTVRQGTGTAGVRFAANPHTLRVTPLRGNDHYWSSGSDIDRPGSSFARCVVRQHDGVTLTFRAVQGVGGGMQCRTVDGGPVLEVPVAAGESTAHVLIHLAAVDSPTIFAMSATERPVPFTLLNPTPSDVNSL